MRTQFNFRDVLSCLGIPLTNENDWAAGHHLRRLAARHGIEPDRPLTTKTDPDPTVRAPHSIAHYPMYLFDEAVRELNELFAESGRQQDLFR